MTKHVVDWALDWTQQLVAVPSVTGTSAVHDVLALVQDLLARHARCEVQIFGEDSDHPVLLAHAGAGRSQSSLLLSGHVDVVPPAGMTDPWKSSLVDGRLTGRGSTDMKSGAACCLAAFSQASQEDLSGDLWLLLTTDEETSAAGVREALSRADAPRPSLALIAEPTSLHIENAHPGECWIEVQFHGRSAHSSRPHLGINAVEAAAEFVHAARKALPELLKGASGTGKTVSSIDRFECGSAINVVPELATVVIDFRYEAGETAALQLERVRSILKECQAQSDFPPVTIGAAIIGDWPPLNTDLTQPVAQAAVQALEDSLGAKVATSPMSGWGEGGFMQHFGIPAFYFGPGDGKLAHTPHETVSVEHIRQAAPAIYAVIERVCR